MSSLVLRRGELSAKCLQLREALLGLESRFYIPSPALCVMITVMAAAVRMRVVDPFSRINHSSFCTYIVVI